MSLKNIIEFLKDDPYILYVGVASILALFDTISNNFDYDSLSI